MTATILCGDVRAMLATLDDNSVTAVVTDPPYGIRFMGKAWDGADIERQMQTRMSQAQPLDKYGKPRETPRQSRAEAAGSYDLSSRGMSAFQHWACEWGADLLRVVKPGGHLLAFGGSRTHHRLMCGLEDAGWEIRDCLMWMFGSGFPKSHNLDGEWDGWGTALKPGYEPIVLARKPISERNIAANVARWGTGALNIDGTRIATNGESFDRPATYNGKHDGWQRPWMSDADALERSQEAKDAAAAKAETIGRWPANVLLSHHPDCEPCGVKQVKGDARPPQHGTRDGGFYDVGTASSNKPCGPLYGDATVEAWNCVEGCPVAILDAQSGELGKSSGVGRSATHGSYSGGFAAPKDREPIGFGDSGGASRFFYVAKASREERNRGLDALEERPMLWSSGTQNPGSFQSPNTNRAARNPHPTVKPIELMQYLCRLVTPPSGTVLDPFAGSGSTLIAALREGFNAVGIDVDPDYCDIARRRVIGDAPLFNRVAVIEAQAPAVDETLRSFDDELMKDGDGVIWFGDRIVGGWAH